MRRNCKQPKTAMHKTIDTCCLQPEIHLGLRRVRHAVSAKVHLFVLHQDMSQRVSKGMVLVSGMGVQSSGAGGGSGGGAGDGGSSGGRQKKYISVVVRC